MSAHSHTHGSAAARNKTRLAWALGLTLAFMVAEVVAGLLTGSLALLADAAHMLTDAGGLLLALVAIRFGEKPATPQKTYGYARFEILAALANAVVLLVVAVFILYEAYHRFLDPPKVIAGPMLIVAVLGLGVRPTAHGLALQGPLLAAGLGAILWLALKRLRGRAREGCNGPAI